MKKFSLESVNFVRTPMSPNVKLTVDLLGKSVDSSLYRSMISSLLYLTTCKVEFIQPSNWLYSVPNLLVIQHLVTLYLGGFDVRVVSEIE